MNRSDILKELITLPKDIQEKELALLKSSQTIDEKKLKLELVKLNIVEEVSAATTVEIKDGASKTVKTFPNEERRKVEIERRMKAHHQALIDEITKLEIQQSIASIELGYLKRRFRAVESVANCRWDESESI